jgi:hypothetical protein
MSRTTTIVLLTVTPLLLSGFFNRFGNKNWILYFPLLGIALAIVYFGHLGIRSLDDKSLDKPKTLTKRPYILVRDSRLLQPLAVGSSPTIQTIVENISQETEVQVSFKNLTVRIESELPVKSLEYVSGTPRTFKLAPTEKTTVQFGFNPWTLTDDQLKAVASNLAEIYFFAKVEYSDELGDRYSLPYCRRYEPAFLPQYLVFCSEGITFREPQQTEQ